MTVQQLSERQTHEHGDPHGDPMGHPHGHEHEHAHDHVAAPEAQPPTTPSQAVVLDVGEHTGALILTSTAEREGIEVEIHPASEPAKRTHVWVLPRQASASTVFAAVFPSLSPGDYAVLERDGSIARTVTVPANRVTYSSWGVVDGV